MLAQKTLFWVCSALKTPLALPAVQNERQPRNSAQVRQEQIEAELENSLAPSAATVSATHPAFVPNTSLTVNQHRRFPAIGLPCPPPPPASEGPKQEHDDQGL